MNAEAPASETPTPVTVELSISIEALLVIVELTKSVLTEEQYAILKAAILKLGKVVALLRKSKVSIKRMRRLFFKPSESTKKVLGKDKENGKGEHKQQEPDKAEVGGPEEPKRWSNEGKHATEDYTGAPHVPVANPLLQHKGPCLCPCCEEEARFHKSKIVMHLHMEGAPPVQGVVYELDQARCSKCGSVITASPPPGTEKKFGNSALVSVVLHHYDAGMPFYTMEQLQDDFGIPLPAGTQWGLVEKAANPVFRAVHNVLMSHAADGSLFYTDDTVMKILRYLLKDREMALGPFKKDPEKRTGLFTTGIVSVCGKEFVVLYFTGARHAGENLALLLVQRDETLPLPLLMCDGADRNVPWLPGPPELQKRLQTVDLQCNAHARRNFVDVADDFAKQVEKVLLALEKVYATDAKAKLGLSPAARLKLHQDESGPVMSELKEWMDNQVAQKLVEPNSGLGSAIRYMTDRWEALTRFLHVPGAPLDNNTVERALKKVIRLRKRSMFYMNAESAAVGDMCLSLIETCKLNGGKPREYLQALLDNGEAVVKRPWAWLPWNYKRALERLRTEGPEPPGPVALAPAA
jgi:transposase